MSITISGLNIYPVKGCSAISLQEAVVKETGASGFVAGLLSAVPHREPGSWDRVMHLFHQEPPPSDQSSCSGKATSLAALRQRGT